MLDAIRAPTLREGVLRHTPQHLGRRGPRGDHIQFQRAESQQEGGPLEQVVAPLAGLHIAHQEVKGPQQEEAAQHLVIDAAPAQGLDARTVEHPENGGEEPRPAQSGEPRADGSHQRQVGELGGEDDYLEGQRIQPEEAESQHEKRALAKRPDGPLRLWREDRHQEIVEVPDVEAGSQPGEIIRAEPRREAAPAERQAEQRGRQPEGGASQPGHLLSRPMLNTMIPSSRISGPLGAMALSNWKSTRSESPVSRLAGMSRP